MELVPIVTFVGYVIGSLTLPSLCAISLCMKHRGMRAQILGILLCAGSPPVLAWEPGYPADGKRMASRGLAVNALNRDDAVAFWYAVYQASEGYQTRVRWTGTFPNEAGTTSAAFAADVERRINYYRAMCGVPAKARVNSGSRVIVKETDLYQPAASVTKSAACQQAALMIAASYDIQTGVVSGMSHNPDPSVPQWSPAAWNAAVHGNLAFGTYGPGSIDEYAVEELLANAATSTWNFLVGHRRWLLASASTDFATGDFPGKSAFLPPTNVLYVFQREEELASLPESPFVSYPPNGFFPAVLNGRFWSLSRRDADFSAATVQMADAAGVPIPVSNVRMDSSYGEPALIWQVSGGADARRVTIDRQYRVTVQGIRIAGIPTTHQYNVTLFQPELLRRSTPILGPGRAGLRDKVKYKIRPIAGARTTRIVQYERVRKPWTEGGEGKKPDVIDKTSPIYPLLATKAGAKGAGAISGQKSFNLTFPETYDIIQRGVPDQIMELGPWIHTKNGSELTFQYRRGLMSDASWLVVEVSSDQGNTWKKVGSPLKGYADARPDNGTFLASYPLPKSKNPLRVRLRYYYAVGGQAISAYLEQPGVPTGIFLDEIKLVNCERLAPRKSRVTTRTSFAFQVPKFAKPRDRWAFGMESEFGGPWLQTGPFKPVVIVK